MLHFLRNSGFAEMKVEGSTAEAEGGRREEVKRGVFILDLVLRVIAAIGAVGSAVAMATTNQTLPFLSQSTTITQFRAQYNDLPAFTFFVISNSIVSAYLLLSLPVSVFNMIKNTAKTTRIILIILDTVALGLVTAGAAAATAIVYLAHKGNSNANWAPFCQQFNTFCQRISGSLIGSFGAAISCSLLIPISSSLAASHPS